MAGSSVPSGSRSPGPGGRADQFEGGLLQWAGDEEAVDDLDRAQPLQYRTAGGQGPDVQARGGRLGERAHVNDDAVRIVGVDRYRDGPQTGGAGDGEHAGTGG